MAWLFPLCGSIGVECTNEPPLSISVHNERDTVPFDSVKPIGPVTVNTMNGTFAIANERVNEVRRSRSRRRYVEFRVGMHSVCEQQLYDFAFERVSPKLNDNQILWKRRHRLQFGNQPSDRGTGEKSTYVIAASRAERVVS